MKRSRIFMGMAALGFAAFGAFAFNVKTTSTAIPAYYISPEEGCQPAGQMTECVTGGSGCFGAPSTVADGEQLYNQDCLNTLRSNTGF